MTGDFDDWGRTIKLDKVGDRFEKLVPIAKADQKHLYKARLPRISDARKLFVKLRIVAACCLADAHGG